jgi:two-component system, NtrC family, nitrogen regulation sensor histidine kinase GlnL
VSFVNGPYAAFDLLATLVAVARPDGRIEHANASFENLLGVPRRALLGSTLADWLAERGPLRETLAAVAENRIATGRFEAVLKGPAGPLPVHVIVNQTDSTERVIVELI